MGDQEKIDLLQLFSKKLNTLRTIIVSVLGIFIILFVTFMNRSSRTDGIHDTQIAQIIQLQEKREIQLDKLVEGSVLLRTNDVLANEEIEDLTELLENILVRIRNAEWAILTKDPSKITRGFTQTGT